jgi:hypothetical protein
MTINRLNQGTTNQVLVKAISGQTTNLLELQDSSGNVVSSIGPTGALGGTVSQPQGLVHLSTTSFSAVSAHSVNDVFSASYEDYLVKISLSSQSASNSLTMRLRASGSDNSSSNYAWSRYHNFGSDPTYVGTHLSPATSWRIGQGNTSQPSDVNLQIYSPFASRITNFNAQEATNFGSPASGQGVSGGSTSITTAYDGFTIIPSAGNITGTVRVYGYRN